MELTANSFTSKTIAIRVNKLYHEGMSETELYDITRCCWRVNPNGRAGDCVYALSVFKGEILAVYRIHEWMRGNRITLTTRQRVDSDGGRYGFVGQRVDDPSDPYYAFVGKSIAHLYTHGNQNPIKYFGF